MRFVNNSEKQMTSAEVKIICSPSGQEIPWTYNNLTAGAGENFGTKVPVATDLQEVSDVEITAVRATYSDGSVWEKSAPTAAVAEKMSAPVQEQSFVAESVTETAESPTSDDFVLAEKAPAAESVLIPNNKNLIIGVAVAVIAVIAVVIGISSSAGKDSEDVLSAEAETTTSQVTEVPETTSVTTVTTEKVTTAKVTTAKVTTTKAETTVTETTTAKKEIELIDYGSYQMSDDGKFIRYTDTPYYYIGTDGEWLYWSELKNTIKEINGGGELKNCYVKRTNLSSNVTETLFTTVFMTSWQMGIDRPYFNYNDGYIDFTYQDKNAKFNEEYGYAEDGEYIMVYNVKTDKITQISKDFGRSPDTIVNGMATIYDNADDYYYLFDIENNQLYDIGKGYASGVASVDKYIMMDYGSYVYLIDTEALRISTINYPDGGNMYYYYDYVCSDGKIYFDTYEGKTEYILDIRTQTFEDINGKVVPHNELNEHYPDYEYIGTYNNKIYYKSGKDICCTSDAAKANPVNDKIFDLGYICEAEGISDNDLGSNEASYEMSINGNYIYFDIDIISGGYVPNTVYYFYDIDKEICSNVQRTDTGTSDALDAGDYIYYTVTTTTYDDGYDDSYYNSYGDYYYGYVNISSGHLNLRETPSTDADIINQLNDGDYVTVYWAEGDWYYIEYYDYWYGQYYYGYVKSDYIVLY